MGKRELVGNRQYTDEFKVEAVRLSESLGMTDAAKRWARRPLGRITYRKDKCARNTIAAKMGTRIAQASFTSESLAGAA